VTFCQPPWKRNLGGAINDSVSFAERFDGYLRMRNISARELAPRIGVDPTTISKWRNNHRSPDLEALARLCRVLRVSADILLDIGPIEHDVGTRVSEITNEYVTKDVLQVPLYTEVHPHGFEATESCSTFGVPREHMIYPGLVAYRIADGKLAGYREGDVLLVDPQAHDPHTDVLVIASVHDEPGDVYRVKKEGTKYVLSKDNPNIPKVRTEYRILGTARVLYRSEENL